MSETPTVEELRQAIRRITFYSRGEVENSVQPSVDLSDEGYLGKKVTAFVFAEDIAVEAIMREHGPRPNAGAKYRDTSTGDEYELGPDLQWRRIEA